MWLKICYVLKDNQDKLLGYIHIPTKQDNFTEEIRWVQARQNGKKGKKVRLITDENELKEKGCPATSQQITREVHIGDEVLEDVDDFELASCNAIMYEEMDSLSAAKIMEQDFGDMNDGDEDEEGGEGDDEDENDDDDVIPSPTLSEHGDEHDSPEDYSVEIRYEPKSGSSKAMSGSDGIRTPSPIEEGETTDSIPDERNESPLDREIDEETRAQLAQISFDNKIRFIYSRRDDGREEILRIPSRQEDFNRGIRHPSSSPKRDKLLSKSSSTNKLSGNRKLSGTKVDTTYTVPTNSNDLKEMIYHQWLEKKKVQTKEEIKAKMLAQKKAAKQAEEEANERKVTAQKIYDAWNNSKTDKMQNEKGMKMKQKQAEKEKMEEALQKKKDAEKYFESWKREKDEKIKKMISQKKKEEKKKDKEKFDMKRQTTEEALKAFESWKAQKARDLAEQKKKEEEEKAKAGEEKLMAFEKKQEALRVYEQWKNVKKSPRAESPQLVQRGRDNDVSMVIDVKITKRNQNGTEDVRSANRAGTTTSPRPVKSSHRLEMATSPVTPRVPRMCRPATVVAKLASLVTKTANQKASSPTTVNTTYSVPQKLNSRYSKSPVKPPNPLTNRVFRQSTSPTDLNPKQSKSPKPVYRSESIYSKTNKMATVATMTSRIRKPASILKSSGRSASPEDDEEVKPKEEPRRRWFSQKWSVYHFLLWKILACLAILYYAEQFLEHLIFKGADPCFKMAAKCLTDFASSASRCLHGFAESFMALKNDTVNKRPGVMTCIPNAMHEFRNCIKPNR